MQPDMGPTKIDMVLIFHEAQQSDASGKCAALYTVELQASLRLGVNSLRECKSLKTQKCFERFMKLFCAKLSCDGRAFADKKNILPPFFSSHEV